ncbi:MAG: MraY family glycosyltransferase [Gemmatimonadota bacterium]
MGLTFVALTILVRGEPGAPGGSGSLYTILLGALAMHVLGIQDDRKELAPRTKFLIQAAIAAGAFFAGLRIESVTLPGTGPVQFSFWPSLLFTVFWLVGIANAFNLVDGADGLAGGAALLATLSMFVASLVLGHREVALLLVVTAAAILGFLHFNFPPATVFLGDSGSLFLGFLLAGLGLASATKAATAVAIAIPLVALGMPVVNTVVAVVRRSLRGERISKADRSHIYHRLMDLGHSPRHVALILYAACGMFGFGSLILLSEDLRLIGLVFLVIGLTVCFGIQRLKLPELLEIRRLVDRGLHPRQTIATNLAIREGARKVKRAFSLPAAFEELGRILERTPFEKAEIWVSAQHLAPNAARMLFPDVVPSAGGYRWCWREADEAGSETARCWEMTLPFLDEKGQCVGRLILRRRMGDNMPAEAQLIMEELLPALADVLGFPGNHVGSHPEHIAVAGRA